MEPLPGEEGLTILRRLIAYAEKIFQFSNPVVAGVAGRRRQLDGKDEKLTSEWIWVTTLPVQSVPTGRAVAFGHQRWDVGNHGFNELVNGWHADHIYKHDPNAIECLLLLAFLACNIFQAFFALHLKPQIRKGRTRASGPV